MNEGKIRTDDIDWQKLIGDIDVYWKTILDDELFYIDHCAYVWAITVFVFPTREKALAVLHLDIKQSFSVAQRLRPNQNRAAVMEETSRILQHVKKRK